MFNLSNLNICLSFSYSIVFEAGLTLHYDKQHLIIVKLISLKLAKTNNLKSNKFDNKIYNDIQFDMIKRGSLLVLINGLSFAFICFCFELIRFFIF